MAIDVPTLDQLNTVHVLYRILSGAMGVSIDRIEAIMTKAKYVLTKDYLTKLLFILEQVI